MAERYDFYVHDNRKITFNLTEPIMREDSGVTDFVFHIPKVLNELEVSDWSWWFVFVNAKKEKYSIALTLSDDPERPLEYNLATYTVDYAMSIKAGSVQFALEAINTGTGGVIDNEWHTLTYETNVKDTLQGNQVEYAETESDIISALLIEVRNKVNQLVGGATPTPVNLKSLMTDHDKVYLYTGSEDGESTGYWYHWNGTQFVPGGLYGAGDPESVQGYVEDWLGAHPEATTTVQDGAITEAKLADDLYSAYVSTGANLFNPTLSSITVNGLTYTFDEEEKTYHIAGTANANTYKPIGFVTLDAGQYKLVGLTEQGSSSTFRVNLYNNVSGSLIAQDIGDGAVFTLSETTVCKIAPYIDGGVTVDTTIKAMVTTYTHATIDDYAPYLYGENRLDLNVAKLKYDLYKTKLTGNKINNYDTGWLYDIAQNWVDNASNIFYGYDNNLFCDTTVATDGKYPLTCSVFVASMIFGISYDNSKYNNLTSNAPNSYGYKDDTLIENLKSTFDSRDMLSYFIEKGYAFVPASSLEDVHTGDILYYNLSDGDDITSGNFMGVDHSAIYAYRVSSTQYAIWEVGDNSGPKLVTLTHSARNLVMAVRVPYNAITESKRRTTLSVQQFAGPVALTSLFDFKHNNTFNIWKVSILGKAYAKGASSSSIYLIRTNASGVINEAVPLFEGTGSSVRKLDENYNIIDSGGYYNQPVTILAEWLG